MFPLRACTTTITLIYRRFYTSRVQIRKQVSLYRATQRKGKHVRKEEGDEKGTRRSMTMAAVQSRPLTQLVASCRTECIAERGVVRQPLHASPPIRQSCRRLCYQGISTLRRLKTAKRRPRSGVCRDTRSRADSRCESSSSSSLSYSRTSFSLSRAALALRTKSSKCASLHREVDLCSDKLSSPFLGKEVPTNAQKEITACVSRTM